MSRNSLQSISNVNRLSSGWRLLFGILLFTFFILTLIPLLNVLAVSFSERAESMEPGIKLLPTTPTIEGYSTIWNRISLDRAFFNSLFVSSVSVVLQVLLSSLAAYVLIQRDLPGRRLLTSIILLTLMIPGDLTLISTYLLNRQLNLLNSYTGLIVNGLISGFAIMLLRNYFQQVPESLAESARIDGATELRLFFGVYLPLSIPGLASIGFLEFVGKWNALMIPVSIISRQELYTLPMLLKLVTFSTESTSGIDFIAPNAQMAAVVITVLPLIALYFLVQNYLIEGLTFGATKG